MDETNIVWTVESCSLGGVQVLVAVCSTVEIALGIGREAAADHYPAGPLVEIPLDGGGSRIYDSYSPDQDPYWFVDVLPRPLDARMVS